jgi:hypothetical protein
MHRLLSPLHVIALPTMSQHASAHVPPALSIAKICDAQREFDASVRALNDFFVRKKRGSSGMLLTPTRSLHEKGLVSAQRSPCRLLCSAHCNPMRRRLPTTSQSFLPSAPPAPASPPLLSTPTSSTSSRGAPLPPAPPLILHQPPGPRTPPWRASAFPLPLSPPPPLQTSPTR